MRRVKVLPNNLAGVIRYTCACGHCEDFKAGQKSVPKRDEVLVLEGFHE